MQTIFQLKASNDPWFSGSCVLLTADPFFLFGVIYSTSPVKGSLSGVRLDVVKGKGGSFIGCGFHGFFPLKVLSEDSSVRILCTFKF